MTVIVEKEPGAKLGLTLSEVDDKLVVTKVKKGGLVAGTELAPGMEIFSIDGIEVAGKSASEAAGILVDADGTLTIIAFKGDEESNTMAKVAGGAVLAGAVAGTAAAIANATKDGGASNAAASQKPEDDAEGKDGGKAVGTAAGVTAAAAAVRAIPRSSSLKSTMAAGTFTMAVINKEPGERLGFRLGLLNETVVVSGIGEGSLARLLLRIHPRSRIHHKVTSLYRKNRQASRQAPRMSEKSRLPSVCATSNQAAQTLAQLWPLTYPFP